MEEEHSIMCSNTMIESQSSNHSCTSLMKLTNTSKTRTSKYLYIGKLTTIISPLCFISNYFFLIAMLLKWWRDSKQKKKRKTIQTHMKSKSILTRLLMQLTANGRNNSSKFGTLTNNYKDRAKKMRDLLDQSTSRL